MRFLIFLFLSFSISASPVIPSVKLDEELAAKLGFELSISSDKYSRMIELKGPASIDNQCKPLATGIFIIDENGEEISAFVTSANIDKPESIGYIEPDSNHKIVVFIDYKCANSATRYEVSR